MKANPLLNCDFYKIGHHPMYPEGTSKLYSNFTPRKSRIKGINSVVVFLVQYLILDELIENWNENFFKKPLEEVIGEYNRIINNTLGAKVSTDHIEALHKLGYLPLQIKALPEGSECPIGVPMLTITNTVDHAFWLVNYLETVLSLTLWQGITSATIAKYFKSLLDSYALKSTASTDGVQFQGHDFSMRGMSSMETACVSGAGHLLSFDGTDVIPAISFLENYYEADVEKELVGTSVPATEHSVMCMGEKESEVETFRRLLHLFPEGFLSVVSDTWSLWKVLVEYLPALKEEILARNGKLVIRPDSGDPVKIITGYLHEEVIFEDDKIYLQDYDGNRFRKGPEISKEEFEGVISLLYYEFGGTFNDLGYIMLDPHIGAIYGDSITVERAEQICVRLMKKGFATTNIVLGIGSYTYQYNTRDTFGFAMKATYGEVAIENHLRDDHYEFVIDKREIFKDPITDDGTKRSAKGLLRVDMVDGVYKLKDQCTEEEEKGGALETVFLDGVLTKVQSLKEIRERVRG